MKTNSRIFPVIAAFTSMSLIACTTPKPTYSYQSVSSDDPEISFESDFDLHTDFHVNIKNPTANKCEDFDRAGYLLKVDSIMIYDKPNRTLQIKAPSGKPISFSGSHFFSDGSYRSSCGPLTRMFTPLSGNRYVAKLRLEKKVCFLTIERIDSTNNSRQTVESQTLPKCAD